MSYILDALKRADAERERERGTVPGLHARQVNTPAATTTGGARSALWLAAAVLAFCAMAATFWVWRSPVEQSLPGVDLFSMTGVAVWIGVDLFSMSKVPVWIPALARGSL